MTGAASRDRSAHAANPAGAAVLDLRLGELRQIFDSMDPAPFRERDLDPKAADYIVGWAEETAKGQPLALVVHVDRPPAPADSAAPFGAAVDEYFRGRAAAARRELSRLFRVGRVSLVIGLAFLAAAITAGEMLVALIGAGGRATLVQETLIIGGWVALWRPMEIFLYDWWPIRDRIRLYERLAAMPVSVRWPGARAEQPV